MYRSGETIVARIVNTETRHGLSMGYGALIKLMSAFPFVTRARETLLSEMERGVINELACTPTMHAKRKLNFEVGEDSDDSPLSRPSQSLEVDSDEIPPSQLRTSPVLIPLEQVETRKMFVLSKEGGDSRDQVIIISDSEKEDEEAMETGRL